MNKDEIIEILNNPNDKAIYSKANQIRKKYVGDKVHLRALIEFSNICKCNCHYCGLRCQNNEIERYKMSPEEIINQAKYAKNLGYKTIVLQSGENDNYSSDELIKIIKNIKSLDVALTLSIGEKSFDEYKEFKKAGADRYLLRIETTDKNLYKILHPKASFENRLRCLEDLKKLDYEVGSGSLIGLANQTIESIADDILFFIENDFDMIGIGPFIPHQNTPLKNAPMGDFYLALCAMAIVRINMKDINIPATTAMETIKKQGRLIALQAGANVIMPNLTPNKYQKKYEIYPNKANKNDRKEIEQNLLSINRLIANDFGNRKNK